VSSPIKTLICVFVFARSHSFFPPTYLIQKRVSLILLSDRRQPDGSDCIFFKIVCIIKIERKVKRNGKNCHQLFKKGSEKRHWWPLDIASGDNKPDDLNRRGQKNQKHDTSSKGVVPWRRKEQLL
jgi:hypothetical protein